MENQNKVFDYLGFQPKQCDCNNKVCSKECLQYANVSVPVEIKPIATVGNIIVECCDEPVVTKKGKCNDSCDILVSQKLCIKIPITYNVQAKVGDSVINCENPNCCK